MPLSDYSFSYDGPLSPLRWIFYGIILCMFALATCFEYIFCGRWRDLLPREPADHEGNARRARVFRASLAPEPLPAVRPRALTLSFPADEKINMRPTGQMFKCRQDGSFFCAKLPTEVRVLVYEHVICRGGDDEPATDVFHILGKEKKLGYWRCRNPTVDGRPCNWSKPCCGDWLPYKVSWRAALARGALQGWEKKLRTDGTLLPLIQSCRFIYTELTPLLYSLPHFHFPDPGTIAHFSSTSLASRLALVQRLSFDWEGVHSIFTPDDSFPRFDDEELTAWRAAWSAISQLKGLRQLRVTLKRHRFLHLRNRPSREDHLARMYEPLMKAKLNLKELTVFELNVEWDENTLKRQLGRWVEMAPFTIKQVTPMERRRRRSTGSFSSSSSQSSDSIAVVR